jgi:hypothetical protein
MNPELALRLQKVTWFFKRGGQQSVSSFLRPYVVSFLDSFCADVPNYRDGAPLERSSRPWHGRSARTTTRTIRLRSNPITSPFPSLHTYTLIVLTAMYSQDDIVQPRDRRAWTEEEDELLRAAIEKGTASVPHSHVFTHTHRPLKPCSLYSQRTQERIPHLNGMLSQSTYPTEPTRIVANGGGPKWPPASQKAPGVLTKMSVCSAL